MGLQTTIFPLPGVGAWPWKLQLVITPKPAGTVWVGDPAVADWTKLVLTGQDEFAVPV